MKNNVNETNKKVIVGISIGAVALVAVIILAIVFGGNILSGLNHKPSDKNKTDNEKTYQTQETGDNTSEGSGSNPGYEISDKDTGNKSVEVKDISAKITDSKIIVPIYATKNEGMTATKLVLEFDTNVFEYADCQPGDIFSNCQGNMSNGKLLVVAQSGENEGDVKGAGVITNIVLVPKAGAVAGNYEIKVSKESEYANWDGKFVTPTVKAGKITLE